MRSATNSILLFEFVLSRIVTKLLAKMASQNLPPSYSEVFPANAPSAPIMTGNSPTHNPPIVNVGWNPDMNNQNPQFSMTPQPVIYQPQQQQGMHQQVLHQAQQTIIISQQLHLGRNPITLYCPHCKQQTLTKTTAETSWLTHMVAGALCIIGCWPCCCLPYCIDSLKATRHDCKRCNGYIGVA